MFEKIIVVCVGNICRSPLAAQMLRNGLPDKDITSAGLHAMVGQDVDAHARRTAEQHGLVLDVHEAQQFTEELANDNDLILVMEQRHRNEIGRRWPQAMAKTMLLGEWSGINDIPDPYKKSSDVFEQVYKMMQQSTDLWIQKIAR